MWQVYIFDDAHMQLLYDVWISAEDSLQKKAEAPLSLAAAYAREAYTIAALLGKPPHEITVVDFGMGWGHWCLMAKAFGYTIYGMELSKVRADYAAANGIPSAQLEEFPPQQIDFINSEQVFEHIPKPLETLRALVRLLKPAGVIRIAVPNAGAVVARLASPDWKAGKDAFHPLEHINSFNHQSLIELARRADLRPIQRIPKVYLGY